MRSLTLGEDASARLRQAHATRNLGKHDEFQQHVCLVIVSLPILDLYRGGCVKRTRADAPVGHGSSWYNMPQIPRQRTPRVGRVKRTRADAFNGGVRPKIL